jgi:hypothetical protein
MHKNAQICMVHKLKVHTEQKIPTKQQINDLSLFYPIGSFENGTLPYRTGTNESIHAKNNT